MKNQKKGGEGCIHREKQMGGASMSIANMHASKCVKQRKTEVYLDKPRVDWLERKRGMPLLPEVALQCCKTLVSF